MDLDSLRLAEAGATSWHFVALDTEGTPCLLSLLGSARDYVLGGSCASLAGLERGEISLGTYNQDGMSAAVLVPDGYRLADDDPRLATSPGSNVVYAEGDSAADVPESARFERPGGGTLEVSMPGTP